MSLTDVVRIIGSLASLGKVLKDEYTLLSGVSDKVEEARKELELIQAYLKDADAKAADTARCGHEVKEWVNQVRETAFGLDDAVGFFLRKLARVRAKHIAAVAHPIMVALKLLFSSEIDEIIKTIRRLNEQRQNLDLSPSDGEQRHLDHRRGSLSLKDEELVGVNDTKELLHHWLLEGEPTRTVINLFGEGGLGKTSIAWNVYKKHKDVEKSFDCYAWITVTRSLKVEDLLKTVLEKLYENERNTYVAKEKSDIVGLGKELLEYLHGRRYMVVFDNVQMTEFWGDVHFAFPDNRDKVKRSRIMITSRDEGVGKFCRGYVPTHIREVKPLRSDDALKLFHRRTFQCDPQDCPEEFKKLSQDFVKRCQGVPLAIVALSCLLLSQGKMVSTWEETYSSLRSKFKSNPHLKSYEIVLSESYHDLPYHLKPCLLYFGLFPESHVVSCVKLVRLWVAEGFVNIESDQDQTLEEAAQDYLADLIGRGLVKVSYVDADGTVRSCRVHDLMHIFIMKKCEESSFCQAVVKGHQEAFRFHKWTRRLSIQDNDFPKTDKNYSRVRSCVVCDVEQLPEPALNLFLSCYKLLVALDLEGASLDHLPDAVAKLINLKYLSVRKTKIVSIPKFIGKLQLLETLNLRDTGVRELPAEINKLVKLRHLLSDSHYSIEQFGNLSEGVKLKEGVGGLTALQSLVALDATKSGDGVIREMENMKSMRRLGIANLREGSGSLVCDAIKNMPHLDSLLIKATGEDQVLELQSLAGPPLHLQYLFLDGRLQGLPGWIFKLKNLVTLRLKWSRLAQDPLPLLKDLPELLQLYLQSSCEGEELHFKQGWFQKLKELRLRNFDGLRALKIDEGALPNLEELWLGPCPQMEAVPNDVQNLKALKHLFLRMPSNFVDDISALLKRNNQKTTLYIFSTHTSRWQVKV